MLDHAEFGVIAAPVRRKLWKVMNSTHCLPPNVKGFRLDALPMPVVGKQFADSRARCVVLQGAIGLAPLACQDCGCFAIGKVRKTVQLGR
jgi:hypothetical protein